MINQHWILMATAAASAMSAAAPDFPCHKLADSTVEVFDALEESIAAALGAVEIRKKARLFERRQKLAAAAFAIADAGPAPVDGRATAPMTFRKYRSGAETLLCTQKRDDALFGAGDTRAQFMLRCLVDRDGDGAYESFVHKAELVPYNMRTGRSGPSSGTVPGILALARPIRLVPAAAPARPDPFASAEVLTRISVAWVKGEVVGLRFSGGVRRGPDSLADRMMDGAEAEAVLPMAEGIETPVLGTRIRFARSGAKWTGAIQSGFGREPRLLCGGSVIEAGDTFTILTPGGQSVIARSSLAP
jgi:hypothetical protein